MHQTLRASVSIAGLGRSPGGAWLLLLLSQSVVSDSVRPHRLQPTRLPRPWDSPGKNTGVGCQFLLQCMKVKSEKWKWTRTVVSESSLPDGLQPTRLLLPWDLPGTSTGVGAIAFSGGHGNPLQYSYLENPVERGAWWAGVHGITKTWTQLSIHTHAIWHNTKNTFMIVGIWDSANFYDNLNVLIMFWEYIITCKSQFFNVPW